MPCQDFDVDLARIQELIPAARVRAQAHGPLSGLWDVIFDGEALLHGTQTLLSGSRRDVAIEVRRLLEEEEVKLCL